MPSDSLPEEWSILRQWLPEDLAGLAKEHGFMRRERGIEDADLWLKLILMHVAGGLSLEQTVLRAAELKWAKLSPVALFKRLRQSQGWLAHLTAHLLAQQQKLLRTAQWSSPWKVRVVDATDIQEPGSTGTAWRLHYSLQMPQMVCDHFELTDAGGGEKLGRFAFAEGELVVADRGYSHRAGVAQVLQAKAQALVRWNPASFPLEDSKGKSLEVLSWLRRLPKQGAREKAVWFTYQGQRHQLRLCALRKGRQATQRAQERAQAKAVHRGRNIEPQTLEYAHYVMVLCSAPAESLPVSQVLELYRGRWQVELAFKRLKSLLDAGHVPKSDEASARAWMQAKILTALLVERTLWEAECFSPWGYGLG